MEKAIFSAHKCRNANNCWHFNIYEQEKFHAEFSMNKVLHPRGLEPSFLSELTPIEMGGINEHPRGVPIHLKIYITSGSHHGT